MADRKHIIRIFNLSILLFGVSLGWVQAQISPQFYEYPQNHLDWYTIESEHYYIHYQKGSDRTAQVASKIAEEIYKPVTSLYGLKPSKKVSIVLRDREDYSNGAAYFFDDKIEIWVPALDTPLRGTHSWMRNVITHEFTHIVQLQSSMKRSKSVPAIYFQWLSYEDVRRPDVLYGFPNGIITLPFATVAIPAWFAEGTAQYQRSGLEYDYWDSHRDMLLRTRILSETYLDFVDMGIFTSKTSLERETIYNQGFAFVIYLVDRFGENVISDISQSAANSGKSNFSYVIKDATGVSGKELFDDWIVDRKEFYRNQTSDLKITSTESIEGDGFFNFHPQFSPDSTWFAYLTNRGRDDSRTSLLLKNGDQKIEVAPLGGSELMDDEQLYNFSHGMSSNAGLDLISTRYSFSPDSEFLAYSRPDENQYGETYQDIYVYDLEDENSSQITHSERIQEPAWHPTENKVAAVRQKEGTQNLVLVDIDSGEISHLTNFSSGETIYTPVWHPNGETIYFATANQGTRNIFRFDVETNQTTPLFEDRLIDYRDPWVDPSGEYLYYSSDSSDIFNIYRYHFSSDQHEQLTSVLGGAFMPFVYDDQLFFSEFRHDGYKIVRSDIKPIKKDDEMLNRPMPFEVYSSTPVARDTIQMLNKIDDSEIGELPIDKDSYSDTPIEFEIETKFGSDERTWQPYRETTTGLSIFPVVRFDNYTKLNGRNSQLLKQGNFGSLGENLWRDMKVGAYLSSRDVTERFSIFAGGMIGFGSTPSDGFSDFISPSRLNNLDRDLFFIAEYRGLPFIKRSWSPTLSVELYNQKRNVRDGLSIEEFPCTSCLPESTSVDIRYNIWEANLFLRSKLNRWSLFELGASYSPYNVATDGFFSRELDQFIPGSTSEYFRGSTFSAAYYTEIIQPTRHYDIAPIGLKGMFRYRFQPSNLLQEFEVNDGVLSPVYENIKNHSLELRSRVGFAVGENSTGMITTRGFTYLNNPEDSFYLDYIGGLTGLRAYSFFAVGGQRSGFIRTSYLTPLYQNINKQAGPYTIDKIFGHLFFETGNAWGGPLEIGNRLKSGLGGELRVALNGHYLFPLKFFVNGTYGFNSFSVTLPDDFVTESNDNRVTYGKEFLFYLGLTFDFDLI
ncbi:MAG: hypothetical protein WD381_05310 [Balneolaceae bacterium]